MTASNLILCFFIWHRQGGRRVSSSEDSDLVTFVINYIKGRRTAKNVGSAEVNVTEYSTMRL